MAVFTQLTESEIVEILSHFSISSLKQAIGIHKGTENTNYFIETDKEKYILTIFEGRVEQESIPFILDMMCRLSEENIICPRIIAAHTGQRRFKLENGKTCILQTFMDGDDIDEPSDLQCFSAGKTLANIHTTSLTIQTPQIDNAVDLPSICELIYEIKSENLTDDHKHAVKMVNEEIQYQKSLYHKGLPTGFIHADYFKDNVLFTENFVSGVIDFWFSCVDYFVYDLAIALNAWGFIKGEFSEVHYNSFLEGYLHRRELTELERKALPDMLRLAALRFMATRLYDEIKGDKKNLGAQRPFQNWQKRLSYHQQL
ncbi:MAG: homoserine kinase [Magnetococcales bacterium]|nr:homoserine kinase [Magnetococcales bacterium]